MDDIQCLKVTCEIIGLFTIWITKLIFIVFYVLSHTLPANNVFGIKDTTFQFVNYLMAFYMSLSNAYIIPNLVYKITPNIRTQNISILSLRFISTFVVPIVTSIIFIDDCNRYWLKLWNDCRYHPEQFNIHSQVYFFFSVLIYVK